MKNDLIRNPNNIHVRVMAIDPGGNTGIAWYLDGKIDSVCVPVTKAMSVIMDESIEFFVIERFATSGRISKYGIETIDLVGQVKGWCLAKGKTLTLQSPQSRRAWMERATNFLGAKRRIDDHEDDALAHLFQYLESIGIKING